MYTWLVTCLVLHQVFRMLMHRHVAACTCLVENVFGNNVRRQAANLHAVAGDFYSYMGSSTTPDCFQQNKWSLP